MQGESFWGEAGSRNSMLDNKGFVTAEDFGVCDVAWSRRVLASL